MAKKKGPPTLKGLLLKGKQKYGDSSGDVFDVIVERDKLLKASALTKAELIQKSQNDVDVDRLQFKETPMPTLERSAVPMSLPSPALENATMGTIESPEMREQTVNNTDTAVYVNKNVYVNNTYTERKQELMRSYKESSSDHSLRKQSVNNSETYVYVNKLDYVNDAETKSRLSFNSAAEEDTIDRAKKMVTSVYVNNAETIRKQSENAKTKEENYVNKARINPYTSAATERKQESIYKLSRKESSIFSFIMKLCVSNGAQKTPHISYEQIAVSAETTVSSSKTLVARLISKGFLERISFTVGPGARTVYGVPNESYQAYLLKNNSMINFEMRNQSVNNAETSSQTNAKTTLSSSSINYNNINTNTEEVAKSEPWLEIIIPEVLKAKGFSQTHAKQILSDKDNTFTVQEVQQSFEHFAHDIENNLVSAVKRGVSAIGFFMGILRKNGARNLYVSPVASQKEHAEIELYLRAQKESGEILKQKAMAEIEMKAAEMVRELSNDERDSIAPPNKFMDSGSANQTLVLIRHFKQQSGFEE